MIAESRPEEKEMMISVIMNCLQEIAPGIRFNR